MKNLLKISALAIGLLASFILLNQATKAAEWAVQLEITSGGSGYCVTDVDIDFGQTGFAYDRRDRDASFDTTDPADHRYCVDQRGLGSRSVTLESSLLYNVTTNNIAHIMANSGLSVGNGQATVTQGVCTAQTVSNTLGVDKLDQVQTLFGKASASWELCKIETPGTVDLRMFLKSWQAIGLYSGILTLTIPNFN